MEDWIEKVINIHLGASDEAIDALLACSELKRFLNDQENIASLYIFKQKAFTHFRRQFLNITQSQLRPYLDLNIDQCDLSSHFVAFTKQHPGAPINDPLDLIVTPFTTPSPENAFCHVIHDVFVPILRNSNCKIKDKTRSLVTDLDSMLVSDFSISVMSDIDITSISSLDDELKYWILKAEKSQGRERERSLFFKDLIQNLLVELQHFDSVSLSDMTDISETVQDCLDDIWRQKLYDVYPQPRMDHLMNLICGRIIAVTKMRSSESLSLHHTFSKIKDEFRAAIQTCNRLEDILTSLTQRFWPNFGPHPWIGDHFTSRDFTAFRIRLSQYYELRSSHNLISHLLSPEERNEVHFEKTLVSFRDKRPLELDASQWEVDQKWMISAEKLIAGKLSQIFSSIISQPHQMLQEFQKYKDLMKTESVFRQLASEREAILAQILGSLKQASIDYKNVMSELKKSSGESQKHLRTIIWLKQSLVKVEEASRSVEILSPKDKSFDELASQLFKVFKKAEKEQFASWIEVTEHLIESDTLRDRFESGKVMEMDIKHGTLRVNFDESLVNLIREARQLTGLGYIIPQKILKTAETARKYYRYGTVLKQVAHFYNTIHEQMLPSQYNMLLEHAKSFERLVRDPLIVPENKNKPGGGFDWSLQNSVEDYINKLQSSANQLTSENRRLRKFHNEITDIVVNLMSVDLVKPQGKSKWKELINSIRSIIASAQEGLKDIDTLPWRNHWDHQLYKALEHQKLQFRPPFENIKANYYREMKNIINIPSLFKGLGDSAIFLKMVDNNPAVLSIVYRKTDELFQNLMIVYDSFKDWMVLGTISLEEFVQDNLVEAADWEFNFRMIKAKGKESELIPPAIQIDCVSICTAPMKAAIDDHLQKLFDCLLTSLRSSIEKHLKIIDEFVSKGSEVLGKRPQSLEEIGEAKNNHEKLSTAKNSVAKHFENAEIKNKLLKSVSGGGIDISKIHNKWSRLELMLESHELVVKEQVEILRQAIDGRKKAYVASIEKFSARWKQLKPRLESLHEANYAKKALASIQERRAELEELMSTKDEIDTDCQHFGIDPSQPGDIDEVSNDILREEAIWGFYGEYDKAISVILDEDWISFRGKANKFEDFLIDWLEKVRSREVDALSVFIQNQIDGYRELCPYFKFLRGDSWMSEHWGELFRIVSLPKGISLNDLKFGHLLAAKSQILSKIADIKDLNGRASGEVAIREALQELDMWGASAVFALSDYQDAKGNSVKIVKDWKETMAQVGDNQSLLQSLKDSPYYKHFVDKTQIWDKKLVAIDENLRNLNSVQRKWIYLEPIFNNGALPSEQSRFSRIDTEFCKICSCLSKDNRVVSILSIPNISENLHALVDQLERCQKALNEFLESKRSKFPRFYFVGDEDLLEILGQAQNPNVIQSHLKKLFAGVHQVQFSENSASIIAMRSLEGETVKLSNPVPLSQTVETWLDLFAKEMKVTLKLMTEQCLAKFDLHKYPSQVLELSEYINFTSKCSDAITKGTLSAFNRELKSQLEKYTSFNASDIDDPDERKVLELKVKGLILDIIHFIDVVNQLQKSGVSDTNDWDWKRQLRIYLEKGENSKCVIKMNEAVFEYTFEYQGNSQKLVHTPLTDKCYLTLTQAMFSGFGGNPFGPAGTGKTESVKALGALFGRQVLVFNCDEGIDYKSMGRIFVGLVKCGAWGCFDEFNRLDEAVLSAVSQQIQVIQSAMKKKERQVVLLNNTVDLSPNSGIFVTLNPAGKGYGGRQKLPDNLKQLFRSVAMTHPDNELIAEVILFSEGFKLGKELGTKVVSVFSLCKQLLSHQQHYDWGLRPLKTVLSHAGKLLHDEKKAEEVGRQREALIVVKALRVNTLSKLTIQDCQQFNNLINDVFPEVKIEEISYENLSVAVQEVFSEMNLDFSKVQCEKIYQLHEACNQRMGVVIVGPSGSGKSVLWQVLEKSWRKCGRKIKKSVVNPKAIDRHALLGRMDIDTREWFDGVLTAASRQAVRETIDTHSWIVCDGDIDPEWIESLNSVLDDNRLLTMPNGERIQFGPNVNFIFETHNLKFASPATVSRMGMIYLSDDTLDWKSISSSWLLKQPEEIKRNLEPWMDNIFFKGVDWVTVNCVPIIETSKSGIILSGLSQLREPTRKIEFIYGLIRGLGSNLIDEHRLGLARELFQLSGEQSPDPKRMLDFHTKDGHIVSYQSQIPEYSHQQISFDAGSVPVIETIDVQRTMDTIIPWLKEENPFLVIGPEGAGKNMILTHCFKRANASVATVHCSAQTKSFHLVQRLSQFCMSVSTSNGRTLKPKDSEKLILYLKDINLPKPDKYDTVELIQFLLQLISYKGFYDSNLEWVAVENIQIVASMTPFTGLGKHALSTRFTSVCRILHISYTDRSQLLFIYSGLAKQMLNQCIPHHLVWNAPKSSDKLAAAMTTIFQQLCHKFTVDVFPHYIFNPRDLTQWIIGISRYNLNGDDELELLKAFVYECKRIFRDRLTLEEHKVECDKIIYNVIKSEWGVSIEKEKCVYSCLIKGTSKDRQLEEVDMKTYSEIVAKEIHVYERDFRDLGLILFPEAVENLAKVERTLSQPGGSMLLVGRPGVNRRSNALIVAYMLRMTVFTPNVTRKFNTKTFFTLMKEIMQAAGTHNEQCLLLVEDYQMVDLEILECINSLLSAGEIPGLHSQEEIDAITSTLKESHSEEGFQGSLFEFFVSRIRRNLHIALVMDSSSLSFAPTCESNPAFYSRCYIQWVESWQPESMNLICQSNFKASVTLNRLEEQEKLITILLNIHKSCKPIGATPKHLQVYIKTYETVFSTKLHVWEDKLKYFKSGLQKLHDASKFVDSLSADAQKQEIELAKKQKEADAALKEITDSILKASDQKTEMETLSSQLKEEETKLMRRKEGIERELAEVEPVLHQAQSAVGEIKTESLTEIRSLRAPPPAVRDVLEGVLRLMGNMDTSWNSMKGFLGKRTVKDEIMNFNARTITPAVRESVYALLKSKGDSFEESLIKRASVAAAPLAMWVKANLQYSSVLERISPLETDLLNLTRSLESSKQRVRDLKASLDEVDNNVAILREGFGAKTREAEALRSNLEKASSTIKSAHELLDKLSGEGRRWSQQAKEIKSQISALPKCAMIGAAFIVYLTGTSEDLRKKYIEEWTTISGVENFSLQKVMCSESDQLTWKSQGLPADTLSLENAISILRNGTTSFLVDPAKQATSWLKTHLSSMKPEITKQNDDNFLRTLELSLRFGKVLIVEDVKDLEPVLFPLLRKDLIKQGFMVQLGDKAVDYNENFKIYLVTSKNQFSVPPFAAGLINEVNFTVTKASLCGQLLGVTLKHERPELETQKVQLLKSEEDLKLQLSQLEESVLKELANSDGNILENRSLIESLNETNSKSASIAQSLSTSLQLQKDLDREREKFSPLSEFASNLYFAVCDLPKLNHMYQFSLAAYIRIFETALRVEGSATNDGIELRLRLLISELEKLVYLFVSRSLFKSDRQTFALNLIIKQHPSIFEKRELGMFLGLILDSESEDAAKSDFPSWLPKESRQNFLLLKQHSCTLFDACNFSDYDSWKIPMGQGQGMIAINELKEMASKGGWVCLQNVHLAISWLPELEKDFGSLDLHPKFRLWMTSEPHSNFPISLLQSCLKITVESPPGVKKNLQRIYEGWTIDFINKGSVLRSQALFALAWFHAIIQERRNYIPQGWNKFYEFSAADLRSSADVLSEMCKDGSAKTIQWQTLHGLLESAIYGGRIDDVYDELKLKKYLELFFNDDLPTFADHAEYVKLINSLSEIDDMSMFKLPANVDRTRQELESTRVLGQLKAMRHDGIHGTKIDKESWAKEVMPFLLLWKKLNTGIDLMQKRVKPDTQAEPVISFISMVMCNDSDRKLTRGILRNWQMGSQ
ncbi:Cytoplasmic dynein 2 heavy chain 1 [Entophlyctis luteolus]|nr:Cytoplasmic dynein 2 heavy chain 1 [Entophlyctis luteolus]